MDTNKYQIFLKVLEHRSFSKAAAELGYTQSAVSHSIAVMEKEFGFQLINRKDNKIYPLQEPALTCCRISAM